MTSLAPCIFVFGSSFAGKTCLISHLVLDFPQVKTVNYELYYHPQRETRESMTGFYGHIFRLLKEGTPVIAETINDYQYNAVNYRQNLTELTPLNIQVMPEYQLHQRNMETFREAFGSRLTNIRSLGRNAVQLQNAQKARLRITDYITYDSTNYNVIRDRVAQLLGASPEVHHGGI